MSVGAAIARATSRGSDVTVLTVLAGDPTSQRAATKWDRYCGYDDAATAARARREEDLRACELLGANAVWLTFFDEEYGHGGGEDEMWSAMEPHLAGNEMILLPGFPLRHRDHGLLTRLLVRRLPPDAPLALYVEQPTANFRVMGHGFTRGPVLRTANIALRTARGRRLQHPVLDESIPSLMSSQVEWLVARATRRDRRAKREAIRAYASQLQGLGRWLISRIELYEHGWGGEGLGLVNRQPASG